MNIYIKKYIYICKIRKQMIIFRKAPLDWDGGSSCGM